MSDDNALDQNEVEKLLAGLGGGGAGQEPTGAAPNTPPPPAASTPPPGEANSALDQSEVEALLSGKTPAAAPEPSAAAPPSPPTPPLSSAPIAPPVSPDDNKVMQQNEIESLLKGVGGVSSAASAGKGIGGHDVEEEHHEDEVPQGDIDYLLKRAEEALESITTDQPPGPKSNMPPEVIEFQFPEFGGTTPNSDHATLDQISEVELDLKIELGRTNMYLEDVLKLRKGSVVALDKIAGDAVDIFVNGRLIARGEVLVMNDNFCVRVAELLAGAIPIE